MIEKQAQWARCGDCGHTWICAYLPMVLDVWSKLMKHARCPMCASKKTFLGPPMVPAGKERSNGLRDDD